MDESSILIVGANGQLGTALQKKYPNARAADSGTLDITDADSVASYNWSGVTVVINAAAYTNVDGAETEEGRVAAWRVNAQGVANLAKAATAHNLTLVQVSTEYVFDGTNELQSESEPLSPLSAYGASKAAGEIAAQSTQKHYIVRTSWLIGDGKNFVKTMISLGQKGISPSVVGDQIGRLTFTNELVRAIEHLLSVQSTYGVYNVSNGGKTVSWADVTRAIFTIAGIELKVTDISTDQYFADKPGSARRPLRSTFDLSKLEATGIVMNDWQTDLETYVKKELIR
ncbi:MAG: NAD(P)-dependent oxidoreductase [Patescibacteria group bacterium]|nr:NAD(P)-dependent oxidoreductase [Patescibacteria group bacterium]